MSERTPTPKLVMGHIEIFFKGEITVPDNDAVIHIDGDEDSEIEVHCPNALQLAPYIVKAVNSHDALVEALQGVVRDIIEYERINNLGPNPGRTACWDSVARAKSVLASIKESS